LRRDPAWIGRYRIVRRLGAGGMATVYLAADKRGQHVAVKVLHEHLRDDPVFRDRFAREVTAARRVASFCTARVLDADVGGRTPFIVTEYVDGMSLHDWMSRHGPLTPADVEALAVGVAAALTAIHAAGLAHRDLKPGNVMLSAGGPKVIDFGIAGAIDHTTTGLRFGTPGWLAPEQLAGQPGSPAADVYAWGLLVAWATTGQHPVTPIGSDVSRLPQPLRSPVRAALAVDPRHRPSARQVLLTLCGSDRPARVQAATAPTAWVRQPAAVPPSAVPAAKPPALPPALPPKGYGHLEAAHAKAARVRGRRPLAPTLVDRRRRPVVDPVRMPRRRRRRSGWKVAIVLAALVVGAAFLLNRTPSQDAGAGAVPAAPGGGRPATRTARDGALSFTVKDLRCGDTQLGDWPVTKQAKGRFCLVELRVTNAGSHTGWVFMGSQQLVDSAGKKYGADDWAWVYYPQSRRFTSTVDAGETAEGTLVFDVPVQVRFTKLIVHDTPVSKGTAVNLK
jgi:hypothetical protein